MDATFRFSYEPPVASLTIEGDLEISSRGRLAWRLIDLEESGCRTVRLDMAEVTRIDLGCVRLIEETRQRLAARGARLELAAASSCVMLAAKVGGYAGLGAAVEGARSRADVVESGLRVRRAGVAHGVGHRSRGPGGRGA